MVYRFGAQLLNTDEEERTPYVGCGHRQLTQQQRRWDTTTRAALLQQCSRDVRAACTQSSPSAIAHRDLQLADFDISLDGYAEVRQCVSSRAQCAVPHGRDVPVFHLEEHVSGVFCCSSVCAKVASSVVFRDGLQNARRVLIFVT